MDPTSTAALQHIQLMESRIQRQSELIVAMRQAGEDTMDATRRLVLLRNALEEMRLQLGGLLPTEVRGTLDLGR